MPTKFESVWTLLGGAAVAMNKSKRLTHYVTVSPIAFRHNLRLSPAPAHAQPRGIRTYRREPLGRGSPWHPRFIAWDSLTPIVSMKGQRESTRRIKLRTPRHISSRFKLVQR